MRGKMHSVRFHFPKYYLNFLDSLRAKNSGVRLLMELAAFLLESRHLSTL